MNSRSKIAAMAIGAAMTGLVGGTAFTMTGCASDNGTNMHSNDPAHNCKGQNACKGQGGCKTDAHNCKGHNACKGHGGCKTN